MKKLVPALLMATALPVAAQPQQGANAPSPTEMFMQQLDADKNGAVSEEEFLKPNREQFGYMDKNSDGSVTQDEIEAFHKEMQQRMQQMQMQQQQQQGGYGGGYRR